MMHGGAASECTCTGELDPNKPRKDPMGGRKLGELEKMLGLMRGDKTAGMDR